MRSNAENPNALRETVHLERFTKEGMRQERSAARALIDSRAATVDLQLTARRGQLDRMGTARSDKSVRLQRDDAVHASLLKRKVGCTRAIQKCVQSLCDGVWEIVSRVTAEAQGMCVGNSRV